MSDAPVTLLSPAAGYAEGAIAKGPLLFVSGQIGVDPSGHPGDFVAQFARALDRVLAVVDSAGGRPEDLARMTIYVTDMEAYRRSRRRLGPLWRSRLGRHYPAMALIGASALVDPEALVEIEAVAALAKG